MFPVPGWILMNFHGAFPEVSIPAVALTKLEASGAKSAPILTPTEVECVV